MGNCWSHTLEYVNFTCFCQASAHIFSILQSFLYLLSPRSRMTQTSSCQKYPKFSTLKTRIRMIIFCTLGEFKLKSRFPNFPLNRGEDGSAERLRESHALRQGPAWIISHDKILVRSHTNTKPQAFMSIVLKNCRPDPIAKGTAQN